jgi:hypothetical protein
MANKREERAAIEATRDNDRSRGRGAYLSYYDDLGFSTTPEAYDRWKENEKQWQGAKAKEQSRISEYEEKLNQYKEQIEAARRKVPTVKGATQKAWETHKSKDLKTLTAVDKWKYDKTGERVYGNFDNSTGLPQGILDKIGYKSAWQQANPGKVLSKISGGGDSNDPYVYDVMTKTPVISGQYIVPQGLLDKMLADENAVETLKPRELEEYPELGTLINTSYKSRMFTGKGKFKGELLNTLQAAQDDYYSKYIKAVGDVNRAEIAKAQSIIASKANEYEAAVASVQTAKDRIAAIDSIRNREMNDLRSNYNKKIQTMKEFFGDKE